jgi:nucleoside-diphosphate-sugar epimerase
MRAGLLVNDFCQKAIQEGTLVLYSGHSKRTFMSVNDCTDGYIFALDHYDDMKGQIFNMGHEDLNFSKKDIADTISKYHRFETIDSSMEDKDVRHFYVNFEKARNLGYKCLDTLDDGVQELIKLYKFYDPNSFIKPI